MTPPQQGGAARDLHFVGGSDLTQRVRLKPDAVLTPPHDPGVIDALALVPLFADELLLGTARDTHLAITDRAFGVANRGSLQVARVPQAIHNGIANSVYASISGLLRVAGASIAKVGAMGVGPRLNDSPHGRAIQSAVNGLIGERLREEHSHLALPMAVRANGQSIPLDPAQLAAAFPRATERIVVFIHGLGENEAYWESDRYEMGGTYGSRLEAMASWTPVYLRVNTGLSVSENGVALTALMQQLVDAWPTPVRRISLVGHSMGGLIIRAGCAVATGAVLPWTERISDVITLGTPHLGADLARGAKQGAHLLGLNAESAAFSRILEQRSPGIRDLERGLPELPPLPHVRYRLVSAAVGSAKSPLGWLLGDLFVRRGSATGSTRKTLRLFPDADLLHIHNTDHFGLLNHPDVFRAMKEWLA